jgi:hypothetical protein
MGFNLMLHGKDKITFEVQYRMNKSDTQSTNAFLLNAGFGFRL